MDEGSRPRPCFRCGQPSVGLATDGESADYVCESCAELADGLGIDVDPADGGVEYDTEGQGQGQGEPEPDLVPVPDPDPDPTDPAEAALTRYRRAVVALERAAGEAEAAVDEVILAEAGLELAELEPSELADERAVAALRRIRKAPGGIDPATGSE